MWIPGRSKPFQFYDAGFVSYPPGDDLPGVFAVIRFDDRPAAMRAIMASPFEMMQIACGMDFPDDGVTVACIMW